MIVLYESERDGKQREEIIINILARLRALEENVAVLQNSLSQSTKNKDERAVLREILSRNDFNVKQEDNWARKLWQQLLLWLTDLYKRLFGKTDIKGVDWDNKLKYSIIFIGILIFAIALRIFLRWFKQRAKESKGPRVILGEVIDETVQVNDLVTSALGLARQGDYRMAMRRLYIALLYELDERRMITLHPSWTNREYLNVLHKYRSLYEPVSYLTEQFDLFWYGQTVSNEADYQLFFTCYQEVCDKLAQRK